MKALRTAAFVVGAVAIAATGVGAVLGTTTALGLGLTAGSVATYASATAGCECLPAIGARLPA